MAHPPPVLAQAEIPAERMFEPLLEAYPRFQPAWDAFLEEWSGKHEKPQFLALSDLARCLIDDLTTGRTDQFPQVFRVVERWILRGDGYVREAAIIGLLETLQNTSLHRAGTQPEDFAPWLSTELRFWWDKVNAFWETGAPIHDDRVSRQI